jgi:F-type H+/Na+-transporting ATPase subunit beta
VSDYWIYEDKVVHTATLHRADCQYCNHGTGRGRGRIEAESTWHGPYNSIRAARRRAPSKRTRCTATAVCA